MCPTPRMVKLLQVGLGPIGQRLVRYGFDRPGLEWVGAVDPAQDKVGQPLHQVCQLDADLGVEVSDSVARAVNLIRPDVAVVSTVSDFHVVADTIEQLVRQGIHVVTTCEEMAYPWLTQPRRAARLDDIARGHHAVILGTGVNPGFLMDYLVVVFGGLCCDVAAVRVERFQDAAHRRVPFQQKIGAGLTPVEFETRRAAGTLRHVGLTESMHLIAARFGWTLERTEDIVEPVLATEPVLSGYCRIDPGMATGVEQTGRGFIDGREVMTLVFRAAVGEPDPHDTVEIAGQPPVRSTIPGGINGDVATCAITINAVRSVLEARPGLRVMTDVPTVCYCRQLHSPRP